MAAAVATRPLPPPTTTRAMSSPVDDDATTTTYTVDIVNLNNLLSRLEHSIFSSALDLRLVQQSHLHRTRVGAVRFFLPFCSFTHFVVVNLMTFFFFWTECRVCEYTIHKNRTLATIHKIPGNTTSANDRFGK